MAKVCYLDAENVVLDPGSLVDDIFDGNAKFGQGPIEKWSYVTNVKVIFFSLGQFRNSSRSVTHSHGKLDQTSIGG